MSRVSHISTANVGRFVPDRGTGRDRRWACGELVLERILGVPPIRNLTRAAAIVVEYAGELTICLRCDGRYFGAAHTKALLDQFAERIRQAAPR